MSIASEITRLQTAKANLKTSLEAKGATIASDATIDTYPTVLDDIPVCTLQDKQVTVSAGSTTTISPDNGYTGLHEVTVDVSESGVEEKDINFYDYDGTLIYSYTKSEIQELESLPELPDHSDIGLNRNSEFSKWTSSLSYLQDYSVEGDPMGVGALYDTTDTFTHIYINLPLDGMKIYCKFLYAEINWGDGSSSTNNSGSYTSHEYSQKGDYEIIVAPISGSSSALSISGLHNPNTSCIYTAPLVSDNSGAYTGRLSSIIRKVNEGSSCRGSLGEYVFYGSTNLNVLTFPNYTSVAYLQDYFIYATNIKCLILPSSLQVRQNSSYVFNNAKSVKILFNGTGIGNNIHSGLSGVERWYTSYTSFSSQGVGSMGLKIIPNSKRVTSVSGLNCFAGNNLTDINLPLLSGNMGNSAFSSNQYLRTVSNLGTSITKIPDSCFSGCAGLLSINLPSTVTLLENSAFGKCYSLPSINLPENLTTIGQACFSTCTNLNNVVIPDKVTSIGDFAFRYCISLKYVTILSEIPPTLGTYAFPSMLKIYVPYSSDHSVLAAYQSATNWSAYASIMEELPS